MNTNDIETKIQNEINKIYETNRAKYRRQYPIAKWARVKLEALGLMGYLPRRAGQNDAQDILASTGHTTGGGFNAYGEGESWSYQGTIGTLLAQLKKSIAAEIDETDYLEYECLANC